MDELPLWTGVRASGLVTDRSVTHSTSLPELRAQLGEVVAAWREIVPAECGTADDLRAVLEAGVQELQLRWQSVALAPRRGASSAGCTDVKQYADAVNAALRGVDRQAPALRGVAEWQLVRAVREEVGRLWNTLAARAGKFADRLFRDHRVSGFLRNVSIRACETIAGLAQKAADRLRRGRSALPSASALLALGNAADAYATATRRPADHHLPTAETLLALGTARRADHPPTRTDAEVDIPALVALGRALRKPGPGPAVSAAAARLRSGGDQVRPIASATDQAPGPRASTSPRPGRKARRR